MALPFQVTFSASDRDGVAAAQQLAGAGALTLNGALVKPMPAQPNILQAFFDPDFSRVVSIYSAGDLSLINFTVLGYLFGALVTETLAGPTAGATVQTTQRYTSVLSVTADAAVGTDVEVGSGSTGITRWFVPSSYANPIDIGIGLIITGTLNATVQHTFDNVQTVTSPSTLNNSALTGVTASDDGNYAFGIAACRAVVNSSSGGTLVATFIQAGS